MDKARLSASSLSSPAAAGSRKLKKCLRRPCRGFFEILKRLKQALAVRYRCFGANSILYLRTVVGGVEPPGTCPNRDCYMEREFNFVVIQEEDAFVARCLDFEVTSDGPTEVAAVEALKEAVQLFLTELPNDLHSVQNRQ